MSFACLEEYNVPRSQQLVQQEAVCRHPASDLKTKKIRMFIPIKLSWSEGLKEGLLIKREDFLGEKRSRMVAVSFLKVHDLA